MRILAFTPFFYGWTGSAVNERQLIMHLTKKIDKCYVITFIGFKQIFTKRRNELKINMPENMVIIPLPSHYLTWIGMSCIIGIIALALSTLRKIDFIYIRDSSLSMGFLVFRSLSEKTIVKIGAIVEDELPNKGILQFYKKIAPYLDRLVLARSKRVAVNSEEIYYKLVKRRSFKHNYEPLEIPPGVNLSLIKKVLTQSHKKIPRNNINIGFIGKVAWWQGVDLLVRAMKIVKKYEPSVKLFIIGDGPLRDKINRISKELDIDCKITGYLPHEEALSYLKSLDIMVLPRLRTPNTESIIPIKVIEAWALGIPVIVTRHKVFSNRYVNGEDIVFCDTKPKDVAQSILLLLKDRDRLMKLAKRGPELAQEFSYDKIADRLLSAFLEK